MAAWYPEENIYNLLPSEPKEPRKAARAPRYKSIFRPSVMREIQERKTTRCKTMGIPKLQVPSPKDFLRKHSKGPKLPKRKRGQGAKKPAEPRVPRRSDQPLMGIQSEKNFIAANIAEAVMAVAKKPVRASVDVRKGDKFLIDNSGLVQKYIKKKDFGLTPKYIIRQKEESKKAQEELDTSAKRTLQEKGLRRLSREEREQVLEGLKKNWEAINKEYQSLSVVIDTIPRKLRKEKMEVQMKQLEHDISAFEKYAVVYIADK